MLSFLFGVLFEIALLLVAVAWTAIFGEPLLAQLRWSWKDGAIGVLAALPLLVFFVWTMKSRLPVLVRHRSLLSSVIPKLFAGWANWQLAVISLCAGVCEEALFRGAIQCSLTGLIGTVPALIAVALAFGASHLLSWTYGIIAALMGVYLGLLFLLQTNLLVPMATHAVYDFLALLYLLKVHGRSD
jgi:membrane protease YdiL (CAAX protease family)